jgi:ABC-2 type transport system permease protein
MRRYLQLLGVSLRMSFTTAMQYRVEFVVGGFISLWWMIWTLVPLLVVFGATDGVAGWSFAEALLVVAWFTLLRGVLEGMIAPSLQNLIEGIRSGTLDFVLLKPADAQFLVSTTRFAPYKIFDLAAAGVMVGISLSRLGRTPALADVGVTVALLLAAVAVLYALFILVACAAFWVVRLDNLAYLFGSIFDAARWPLSVFRGVWRFLFTFIIPLGVMTTYPAEALLGRLEPVTAWAALGAAAFFLVLARFTWVRSIGAYTSASS